MLSIAAGACRLFAEIMSLPASDVFQLDETLCARENDLPARISTPKGYALTKAQHDADAAKDRRISKNVSIISLTLAASSFIYTCVRDYKGSKSADHRFTSLETSLRILTASVAPQLYKSISDSLSAALAPSEANAAASLQATKEVIKQLQLSKIVPNEAATREAGTALARVSLAHPELAPVWETASQLISYRSSQRSGWVEDLCVDTPHDGSTAFDQAKNVVSLYDANYHDCTFVIDDERAFHGSPVFARFEQSKATYPLSTLALSFTRVHIVYRGGKFIEAARYVFLDCTFEFKPPTVVPPDPDKAIFRRLMAADLSQPISISTSGI